MGVERPLALTLTGRARPGTDIHCPDKVTMKQPVEYKHKRRQLVDSNQDD